MLLIELWFTKHYICRISYYQQKIIWFTELYIHRQLTFYSAPAPTETPSSAPVKRNSGSTTQATQILHIHSHSWGRRRVPTPWRRIVHLAPFPCLRQECRRSPPPSSPSGWLGKGDWGGPGDKRRVGKGRRNEEVSLERKKINNFVCEVWRKRLTL